MSLEERQKCKEERKASEEQEAKINIMQLEKMHINTC
jgi:hypothetical protein